MALTATLAVDVGDDVEFTVTVENAGPDPVEVTLRSGTVVDVGVFDGETEVWRWSDGRAFTQARRDATFSPGESVTRSLTWPSPSPGAYTAVATFEATDRLVERRAFTVES